MAFEKDDKQVNDQDMMFFGFDRRGVTCNCCWSSRSHGDACPEHGGLGNAVNRQPRTTADEREWFNRVAALVRDESIIPLPSHPRTVRVDPKTLVAAWPLEPGDELIIKNESGAKIEVEAGTLSHGRVQRINELVKERDELKRERDELKQSLIVVCDKLLRAASWRDEVIRSSMYVLSQSPRPERGDEAIELLASLVLKHNESEAGE